jgi:DNA invertase Pin-like site-specific DNA recombinase
MTTIGYARVSTTDQDLDIQVAALKREGCTTIRSEKRSGTSTANREELRTVLDFLRKGDVLMVTRIDRLARSIGDLQDIVRTVRAKGASLKATERHQHRGGQVLPRHARGVRRVRDQPAARTTA